MLEIKKYGTNQYGVWVIGNLTLNGIEIKDIFSTNLKDEKVLQETPALKVKKIKISRSKNGIVHFSLEF